MATPSSTTYPVLPPSSTTNQEQTTYPALPDYNDYSPNNTHSWRFPMPRRVAELTNSVRSILSDFSDYKSTESPLSENESILSDDGCPGHGTPVSPLEVELKGSSETLPIRRLEKTPVEGN